MNQFEVELKREKIIRKDHIEKSFYTSDSLEKERALEVIKKAVKDGKIKI